MDQQLTGLHHITAISADARANKRFYSGTLGLRLVKKTVNQDDTSAYHLFFADAAGSPGTDMTFFEWPMAREQRGSGAPSRTAFRVDGQNALVWWHGRLADAGCAPGDIAMLDGRASLDFDDPEGQRLRLVDDGGAETNARAWDDSPVPAGRQIRGLGPATISVTEAGPTEALLTGVLNMTRARDYAAPDGSGGVIVYTMGPGGPGAELHVSVSPGLAPARRGAGAVHHIAFRVPDRAALTAWTEHLAASGIGTSGEVERYYFRSLYFREPGGTLFELATDGPGFAQDEPAERLGESLALPPFLEDKRAGIEAGLTPLD